MPSVHRQEMPGRFPLTAFGLLEGGKLPVVFPSAGFQLETHHPTDVLRPDQVFADRRLPTMPLSISALSHSEVSGNHTTRCPTTVGRPADGKKTDRPKAARNVCVEPESSRSHFPGCAGWKPNVPPPSIAEPFGEALDGRDVLFKPLFHPPLKVGVAAPSGDVISERLPDRLGHRQLVHPGHGGDLLPKVFVQSKAHHLAWLALGGQPQPCEGFAPTGSLI